MPDLPKDLDPISEGSFLEGQRAVAKDISDRRFEEQLDSLGRVGKKAAETITQAKELAKDGDPDKAEIAALITGTVKGAVRQMTSGRPPAEEARGAAQASPLSVSSPPSTASLPGSTPKQLSHEPSPPKASQAPKKRGRPPKNSNG
jgi:hypothetical protein